MVEGVKESDLDKAKALSDKRHRLIRAIKDLLPATKDAHYLSVMYQTITEYNVSFYAEDPREFASLSIAS